MLCETRCSDTCERNASPRVLVCTAAKCSSVAGDARPRPAIRDAGVDARRSPGSQGRPTSWDGEREVIDTGYVDTYSVRMNLTLSIDERLVERARAIAREQGTSLNALIRDYLELLAGQASGQTVLEQFEEMWLAPGASSGRGVRRDDVYEERLNRYKPR
jgi:hypothetical protein